MKSLRTSAHDICTLYNKHSPINPGVSFQLRAAGVQTDAHSKHQVASGINLYCQRNVSKARDET